MRWRGQRESSNVEDRRGGGGIGGFGSGPRVRRGGGVGLGTIAIAFIVAWFLGINPMTLLSMFSGDGMPETQSSVPASAGNSGAPGDEMGKFVSVVLGSTEDVWGRLFQASNAQYPPPKLVLYRGGTTTACGMGSAAAGPFYCPADQKVYIDLGFYEVMRRKMGAPGDFAQAYVIAHEVGHHVQNVTGTMKQMDIWRRELPERAYNDKSVRLELQADCLAGVWAHHSQQAKNWLEQGDIEEAMNAAAAVGDDKMTGGRLQPDGFTHGSSQQRASWFRAGLQSGDYRRCDTFSAPRL